MEINTNEWSLDCFDDSFDAQRERVKRKNPLIPAIYSDAPQYITYNGDLPLSILDTRNALVRFPLNVILTIDSRVGVMPIDRLTTYSNDLTSTAIVTLSNLESVDGATFNIEIGTIWRGVPANGDFRNGWWVNAAISLPPGRTINFVVPQYVARLGNERVFPWLPAIPPSWSRNSGGGSTSNAPPLEGSIGIGYYDDAALGAPPIEAKYAFYARSQANVSWLIRALPYSHLYTKELLSCTTSHEAKNFFEGLLKRS